MRVTTPLPSDKLMIERFSGTESVSKPFELTFHMLSTDQAVSAKDLLGKPMTLTIDLPGGSKRFFNGIVRRFVQRGRGGGLVAYEATVVPSLWLLSLSTDCRIFQAKSVPDIVKAVLDKAGVKDYRLSLTSTYSPREYCVQYRESHLDFISRLLEEEGIFYFFEHTEKKHTLVFADAKSAVKAGPVSGLPVGVTLDPYAEYISELEIGSGVASGGVTLADYNDTMPKRLESSVGSKSDSADTHVLFDYPGKFAAIPDGDRLSRIRLEESEVSAHVVIGRAYCRSLGSGQKLEMTKHYRPDTNKAYHLLSLEHEGRVGGYRTTGDSLDEGAFKFESSFVAIPHDVPFRPERTTPRSIVHGSQTALVVGPSGEEIYVDKLGRVKVQFFWDRLGKKDENSSCWVRVSSGWAGKNWGVVHIPRIGQEVVVDFLEGDPDRPIITGSVYNAEQMPPYALPANGTQSGVKSRSSKQGGTSETNEFRFEDKKGSEEIYLHAQKNLNAIVLNAETRKVGYGRETTIDDKDDKRTVMKGDDLLTVKEGSRFVKIHKDYSLKVEAGDSKTEVSFGDQKTDVKMGNIMTKAGLGSIKDEALQAIELKVGQNSVKIDQMGITIKGLIVKIEGQMQVDVKGMMTSVKADAMLMVKGSITMIN